MNYYKDNYDDYDILYDTQDDEEVCCGRCEDGIFYRLGDWCICTGCGRKIHIDKFESFVNHEFF